MWCPSISDSITKTQRGRLQVRHAFLFSPKAGVTLNQGSKEEPEESRLVYLTTCCSSHLVQVTQFICSVYVFTLKTLFFRWILDSQQNWEEAAEISHMPLPTTHSLLHYQCLLPEWNICYNGWTHIFYNNNPWQLLNVSELECPWNGYRSTHSVVRAYADNISNLKRIIPIYLWRSINPEWLFPESINSINFLIIYACS